MRIVAQIGLMIGLITSTAFSQQPSSKRIDPQESQESINRRLEVEAEKIDKIEVSPLFTAITGPAVDPALRLHSDQINLVRKLESLSREIVRVWLLRDLDSNPLPTVGHLELRLTDEGVKLRESVFSHAETIVLECILDPEQSRGWVKASGTKTRLRLPKQHETELPAAPDDSSSVAVRMINDMKFQAANLDRVGRVFQFILGTNEVDQIYPNGLERLNPAETQLAMSHMPRIALSTAQKALAERLDELARAILGDWLVRGLHEKPIPSQATLVQHGKVCDQIAAILRVHAETIALEAIITPEQSERCLAIAWKELGPEALLDPSLASRLKLTRAQRERIKSRIANKEALVADMQEITHPYINVLSSNPGLAAKLSQVAQKQMEAADLAILGILTPAQSRLLKQILSSGTETTDRIPARDIKKNDQ
jgi:hypothetical protein